MPIHTLNSTEKKKDGEEYYAGGAQSGIAVQGPPGNLLEDVQGLDNAVDYEQYKEETTGFNGAGRSVGEAGSGGARRGPLRLKLTLYSNGFTLSNAPDTLRSFTDPANRQFLTELQQGKTPAEFAALGSDVDLELVDEKEKEWSPPPKPSYTAFGGSGQTLASSSSSAPTSSSTPAAAPSSSSPSSATTFPIDESLPTTSVQLRLASGKRMKLTVNKTSTVRQVFLHVASLNGTAGDTSSVSLSAGFPPKELPCSDDTIESAGLANAVIVQR